MALDTFGMKLTKMQQASQITLDYSAVPYNIIALQSCTRFEEKPIHCTSFDSGRLEFPIAASSRSPPRRNFRPRRRDAQRARNFIRAS